jgi:hypothetical protein
MIRLEETGYIEIEKLREGAQQGAPPHPRRTKASDDYRKKMSQVFGGLPD